RPRQQWRWSQSAQRRTGGRVRLGVVLAEGKVEEIDSEGALREREVADRLLDGPVPRLDAAADGRRQPGDGPGPAAAEPRRPSRLRAQARSDHGENGGCPTEADDHANQQRVYTGVERDGETTPTVRPPERGARAAQARAALREHRQPRERGGLARPLVRRG